MTAAITHLAFQQYWWILIALLGGILVFLLFVQGGQSLIFSMTKDKTERNMMLNAMGRKWETTFTTLVTFGGAFFASFPLFYATSFGGAYWLWIAILFAFTIQAFSYEYRSKPNNVLGKRTFDILLWINGLFGPLLLGVAVGTFFNGANFILEDADLQQVFWQNRTHGLEAILQWHNLSLGLTVVFLARSLGLLYFMHTINDESLLKKARRHLWINAVPFVVFFLSFATWLLLKEGFAVVPATGTVQMEAFKYLHNFLEMPIVLILFLLGVIAVLYGIIRSLLQEKTWSSGFWFSGPGSVVVVFCLFLLAGFNNTAFYPSVVDLQSSLTIQNASSSLFTLKTMSIVSLLIPFVIAYIAYAWRAINKKKLDREEIEDISNHAY